MCLPEVVDRKSSSQRPRTDGTAISGLITWRRAAPRRASLCRGEDQAQTIDPQVIGPQFAALRSECPALLPSAEIVHVTPGCFSAL